MANEDKVEEFKERNSYFSFVEKTIKEVNDLGYDAENVLLSGFAYVQLFGQPLKKQLRYLFIECKSNSCVFYLDEIKRMTLAEIDVIYTSSPHDILHQAVHRADVIVTVSDIADKVKEFVEPAGKTVINGRQKKMLKNEKHSVKL